MIVFKKTLQMALDRIEALKTSLDEANRLNAALAADETTLEYIYEQIKHWEGLGYSVQELRLFVNAQQKNVIESILKESFRKTPNDFLPMIINAEMPKKAIVLPKEFVNPKYLHEEAVPAEINPNMYEAQGRMGAESSKDEAKEIKISLEQFKEEIKNKGLLILQRKNTQDYSICIPEKNNKVTEIYVLSHEYLQTNKEYEPLLKLLKKKYKLY